MTFSVIIPIYNVEPFIERCVRSVMEQTYADKEIILVNDATPDRSMSILAAVLKCYPEQPTKIIHHPVNRGLAAARKTGLEAASGEYIVSVDSDDYLEPDALALLALKAQETDADVIAYDCYFEWANQRKAYHGCFTDDAQTYSRILVSGAALPNVWRHAIRKNLYVRTGIFPTPGLDNGEDYAVTPCLCWYANRIAKVETPLYHYSQTNTSSIVRTLSKKNIDNLVEVLNRLTAFYADKPECREALRAGQWQKKTELMMRINKKDYPLADSMPALLPVCTRTLTLPQRLAAPMIARHRWELLWVYSRIYSMLMEGLQYMKGRRKSC